MSTEMEDISASASTKDSRTPKGQGRSVSSAGIWLFIIAIAALLGFYIYLYKTESDLFLFGHIWDKQFLNVFYLALIFIGYLIMWIGQPKSGKRKVCMILCLVMIAFYIWGIPYSIYRDVKNTVDMERIVLSDGNEVLFTETISHVRIIEETFEHTYINVYQMNGIIVKKIGEINESYFSNKCLLQDKYSYEYDEADRKLTVLCEYGTYGNSVVTLKEEYDTGIWSEEFVLE